jgi:hypothetical protein
MGLGVGRVDRASIRPVLVVGTDDWAVEQVVARLTAADIPTLTCHPAGAPAFPCNALVEGRTCPLDVGFDVVVNVRARPVDVPEFGEFGAVCGLRAGAVIVTAGISSRDPFATWATTAVGRDGNLPEVVARVAVERAAARVVTDVTDVTDGAVDVRVTRRRH